MTSRSRQSRREARRAEAAASSSRRWLLPAAGLAVVLIAAVAAIALTSGGSGGASSTVPPSASAGAGASVAPGTAPTITGTSLPVFASATNDTAVGMPIPVVEGTDFTGQPVAIELDGRAKVLLFLAHWCPHCQAEVPVVQDWVDGGGLPADVDLISVATSIDANAPNYPPADWLAREGWTAPVIVDPANTVAGAYGLPSFPYWVFVRDDGTVAGRLVGELTAADLDQLMGSLR